MSHTTGRQRHPRSRACRVCVAGSAALLLAMLLAGCGGGHVDTNRVQMDSQPVTAIAKAMRHNLHRRVARIVDVRADYAARHKNVKQAVMLVDQRAGKQVAVRDFRHHPVIVRYTSIDAAKQAVGGLPTDRFARVHATVLLLPAGFPQQAATRYRKALLLQAFPTGIPALR